MTTSGNDLIYGIWTSDRICVDYASKGGGDIAIKIQGLRKEVRTSSSVKTIEIENFEIQGEPKKVGAEIRRLLQPKLDNRTTEDQ